MLGFRVKGVTFRVRVSGFRVQGQDFRGKVLGYRVQAQDFRVKGLTFRACWLKGLGFIGSVCSVRSRSRTH